MAEVSKDPAQSEGEASLADTDDSMRQRVRRALTDRFDERTAQKAVLERRGGHASLRIYWRIELPPPKPSTSYPRGDRVLRAMVLPQPDAAPGGRENIPSDLRDDADAWPFVNVQRYLHRVGLAVPDVDHADLAHGVLLIEDLGEETFEKAVLDAAGLDPDACYEAPPGPLVGHAVFQLYREVLDMVLKLHRATRRSQLDPSFGEAVTCVAFERSFERSTLRWELDHYLEWGLQARLGDEAVASHEKTLTRAFDRLAGELLALPRSLALKDLQSRNIMRKAGRWYLIDFQDALLGPFVYDLVALLRDSYVLLDDEMVDELLEYYIEAGMRTELAWCADPAEVKHAFHLQTVQRKLKDAGRFIFLEREKGKDDFLPYYAPSIHYVQNALEHLPEFEDLHEILHEIEPAFKNA